MVDVKARLDTENCTVLDAMNWVAFRAKPSQAPKTIVPDAGKGRILDDQLMAALAAKASSGSGACLADEMPLPGQRSQLSKVSSPASPSRYQKIVCRWMREEGLSAVELLVKAEADLTQYRTDKLASEQQQQALTAALAELNKTAQTPCLSVWGRPSDPFGFQEDYKPREKIPGHFIDEKRKIDASGQLYIESSGSGLERLIDHGPLFHDIQFSREELRKLWPAEGDKVTEVLDAPSLVVEQSGEHLKGGRPPIHDWERFYIRLAWWVGEHEFDPEEKFRSKLHNAMLNWCSKQWGDKAPAERNVRSKIAAFYKARPSPGGPGET